MGCLESKPKSISPKSSLVSRAEEISIIITQKIKYEREIREIFKQEYLRAKPF